MTFSIADTCVAETVNTNQFKNGMHIELDGGVWRIVEFQHVKPGKGGAFVRTKLKALDSGAVVDRTFRAGEKFARVHTEIKNVQYLYDAGDEVVFMDEETYEQIHLPRRVSRTRSSSCSPSSSVQMLTVNGEPSGVQLPASVELAVTETEPGVKGDTVSNVTKPATLETGAVVQVPLFVNPGDRIKVDPRENGGTSVARELTLSVQRSGLLERLAAVLQHRLSVRDEHELDRKFAATVTGDLPSARCDPVLLGDREPASRATRSRRHCR